jgi:hypothetical protein
MDNLNKIRYRGANGQFMTVYTEFQKALWGFSGWTTAFGRGVMLNPLLCSSFFFYSAPFLGAE